MQISRTLFNQMVQLWGSSTVLFIKAAGSEPQVVAIVEDFPVIPVLTPADLTFNSGILDPLAMFTKDMEDGQWYDTVAGESVVSLKSDVEGDWLEKVAVGGTPTTVYGFGLLTRDGVALLAVTKLPEPILVQAVGQGVVCRDVEFRFPTSMVR